MVLSALVHITLETPGNFFEKFCVTVEFTPATDAFRLSASVVFSVRLGAVSV